MGKHDDIFGEEYDPGIVKGLGEYHSNQESIKRSRKAKAQQNKLNEVGMAPPITEDIMEERLVYRNDFVLLHEKVFPDSTGIAPFGEKQEQSIRFGQDVFEGRLNRLLKLEPRGFAKTTRITNEALAAVLLGMQEYIVILCSNQEKAEEILESIKTEIYNNDELERLFPGPIACFRHINDIPQKARYQTYDGERTGLFWGSKTIRFPAVHTAIPNIAFDDTVEESESNPRFLPEPCSGRFIEIRPMSNVKGLHKKIKNGPDAGKVFRPTLFLIDDPQTFDDAKSETNVKTIIGRIKRDAMRGGKHTQRARAIMSITPVCPGDVAWHFENNEHSWDIIKYKMIEKFPDEHKWWMEEYAKVYLNYDRSIRGDRTRAALEAKQLVEDNYERVHYGSEVTWDHAYGYDEDPQTEISAVQHAYNIILDDGIEDFEYECQCNTEYGTYEEGEQIHCPASAIAAKTLPYRRTQIPQETSKLVAHIDVNKNILSYAVVCSPSIMQPHICDYGTYPKQPGLWSKRNLTVALSTLHPTHKDYRDVLYHAVKALIAQLAEREFRREDDIPVKLDAIGVDIKYEDAYIARAIRESPYKHLVVPCSGTYVDPDDELLHEKPPANAIDVYDNCYLLPNKSRTLDVLHLDTNTFKTDTHRGFNLEEGTKGSLTLFGKESDGTDCHPDRHLQLGEQCNSERPKRKEGKKSKRVRVIWEEKAHQIDNEWFDNIYNCMALLISKGVKTQIAPPQKSARKDEMNQDINDFMNEQKNRRLM